MKGLSWMYKLLKQDVILYECPLCKAVVAEFYDHTEYHKARGEKDKGAA